MGPCAVNGEYDGDVGANITGVSEPSATTGGCNKDPGNVIATGSFEARGRTDKNKYHVSYCVSCLGWFESLSWSREVEAMATGTRKS